MGNNGSAGVRGDGLPIKGQLHRVAPGTLEEPQEDDRTKETRRAVMMNRKGLAYLVGLELMQVLMSGGFS
jgi:hypothetical protein